MTRSTIRAALTAAVAVAVLSTARPAQAETNWFAQPGNFGLGVGATDIVTGVSGKLFLNHTMALQATVGYWYGDWGCYGDPYCYAGFAANLDLIFEMPRLLDSPVVAINWNLGFGGTVVLSDYPQGGLDLVAGLGFQFKPVPIEFVVEFRPTFLYAGYDETPVIAYWGGGVALRYYFGGGGWGEGGGRRGGYY